MPRFGEAHKLLSATHPDTSPPAAGADPADGQVPTWSDALKAWTAQDPTGDGVRDHGLLDGLADDDHPQYALADKSRPTTWVEAADLAPRSLADLGIKDHHLLSGLGDDDHSIYALLAGRSGGQLFKGGSGSGEHVTLQSTAHATRGYVRAQDDLQLLSDILRDSGGNNRLQLATSSPHHVLAGDAKLTGHLGVYGSTPGSVYGVTDWIKAEPVSQTWTESQVGVEVGSVSCTMGATNKNVFGMSGLLGVYIGSGLNLLAGRGLSYGMGLAAYGVTATATELTGLRILVEANAIMGAANFGVADMCGIEVAAPTIAGMFGGSTAVDTSVGIKVQNPANVGAGGSLTDAIGLYIANVIGANGINRILELGPATPYLRLEGGAAPAGINSKLIVNFGDTLYRLVRNAATGAVETAVV